MNSDVIGRTAGETKSFNYSDTGPINLAFDALSVLSGGHASLQAAAKARTQAAARAAAAKKAQRKKNGIFGSIMKGNFNDAWDETVDDVKGVGDWAYDHRKELLMHGAELGITATVTAVACGATAGVGCAVAIGVAFGSLYGGANYMMTTPKSEWTQRGFLTHEYIGAATGGIGARLGIGGNVWFEDQAPPSAATQVALRTGRL